MKFRLYIQIRIFQILYSNQCEYIMQCNNTNNKKET